MNRLISLILIVMMIVPISFGAPPKGVRDPHYDPHYNPQYTYARPNHYSPRHGGYYHTGHRYGYYQDRSGDIVFGLIGLGVAASIVSSMSQPDYGPVYVSAPEPRVMYITSPQPQPTIIYQIQQPTRHTESTIYVPAQQIQQPDNTVVDIPAQQYKETIAVEPQQTRIVRPAPVSATNVVTMTIPLQQSDGSYYPIVLRQDGLWWVGPRGEIYREVPTVGQLRMMYGK